MRNNSSASHSLCSCTCVARRANFSCRLLGLANILSPRSSSRQKPTAAFPTGASVPSSTVTNGTSARSLSPPLRAGAAWPRWRALKRSRAVSRTSRVPERHFRSQNTSKYTGSMSTCMQLSGGVRLIMILPLRRQANTGTVARPIIATAIRLMASNLTCLSLCSSDGALMARRSGRRSARIGWITEPMETYT